MTAETHITAEGLKKDFDYTPNYRDLKGLQNIHEYTEGKLIEPGKYFRHTEVGFIGSKAFYVQDEDNPAVNVSGALMAEVLMDELNVEGPEVLYDREDGKILIEEVPGVPSNDYRASSAYKMAKHVLGYELEGERDEVDRAIGLKYFLGDSDIPPNIVVTENSGAPIDFDKTGVQAEKAFKQARDYAEEVYGHFNWDFDEESFERKIEEMAEEIQLEGLQRRLREEISEAPEHEEKKDYLVRNSLENFRAVR